MILSPSVAYMLAILLPRLANVLQPFYMHLLPVIECYYCVLQCFSGLLDLYLNTMLLFGHHPLYVILMQLNQYSVQRRFHQATAWT